MVPVPPKVPEIVTVAPTDNVVAAQLNCPAVPVMATVDKVPVLYVLDKVNVVVPFVVIM